MIDVNDPWPNLGFEVYDSTGALANAGSVVLTITLPDQTTTTPAVSNTSTGIYVPTSPYLCAQAGRYRADWVATGTNSTVFSQIVEARVFRSAVSLDDARSFLAITADDTTYDPAIRDFMEAATAAVEKRIGPIAPRSVTEFHRGGGTTVMCRNHPVVSVTSVTEYYGSQSFALTSVSDPSQGSTYTYIAETPDGTITRRRPGGTDGVFPDGNQAVQITYLAGRTDVEPDIYQAVLLVLEHMWQTQRGAVRGRPSSPDYLPGAAYSLPLRATELLGPYMTYGIG